MKERPILFSGEMVRAILRGQKTQTRRIAKDVRHPDLGNWYTPGALVMEGEPQQVIHRACPYGQPGERLWVRETFAMDDNGDYEWPVYRADGSPLPILPLSRGPSRWKPAIHMPKAQARIWLEITGVHLERLQEISNADAQAEGCDHCDPCEHTRQSCTEIGCPGPDYRYGYRKLWEQLNGPHSWIANPWVWVIEFQQIQGSKP